MKYIEILKKNLELSKTYSTPNYKVAVLSNVIVYEIKEILEFFLRDNGINVIVDIADYDNIVQESKKFSDYDAVIIFWESINFNDGFHYEQLISDSKKISKIESKVKSEISLVLENLKKTSLVIFNKFSSILFDTNPLTQTKLSEICNNLNGFLSNSKLPNSFLLDIDLIISKIGLNKSKDFRKFYSSKSLYSLEYYIHYVKEIIPLFLSVNGKTKKVLVMDCDNTLWGGILGEDGFDGIKMDKSSVPGKIFHEIQHILLNLKNQGVLLAICSKNNLEDVENVFNNHPEIVLKSEDFVIKKVNWKDKASNLKEISKDLNLGIDSIVFVDDSNFEIGLINSKIPEIETLLVPTNLTEYPSKFYELKNFFLKPNMSQEDSLKTKMYLDETKRKESVNAFSSIDDYLSSLGLELSVFWNDTSKLSRSSQLTQKTNQFNLTTKRYTEQEILKMIESANFDVGIFSLKDSYGDYGLTGMVIIKNINDNKCEIDSFMLSCRVLGRNVEYVFFDEIVKKMIESNRNELFCNFVKSKKNSQVEDFYDKLGFSVISKENDKSFYKINLKNFKFSNHNYIKLK
jgi:FkbH-like protein